MIAGKKHKRRMKMKITYNSKECWTNQIIGLLLILLSSLSLTGCAALVVAGAGAGAYTYISGNLVREYQADYEDLVGVCRRVYANMHYELIEDQSDGLKATLEGEKEGSTSVTISIDRLGKLRTNVGVRTGAVGYANLEESEEIHKKIIDELKTLKKYADKNVVTSEATEETQEQIVTLHAIRVEKHNGGQKDATGSPPPQAVAGKTQVAEGLSYLQASTETMYLYFSRSDRSVPKRMHQALNTVADTMKKNQHLTLHLQGYTDAAGGNDDNIALSSLWAEKVRWYLIERGIAPDRIRSNGYGAANFIESNGASGLQAMNRRVELHFIP